MEYWSKSIRLDGWDYRIPWFYFVTICTKDRCHYFGEIRDGIMGLSEQGCAAWYFWNEIPNHFDNVKLDEFVVMPNHVHGIIQILPDENGSHPVGMLHATCLQDININDRMSIISPKPGSLSTIIRSYKSAHTRWCNQKNYDFEWQSRFHDHIIRNYRALNNIRRYIKMNPEDWESDSQF
ncbi:transposase [Gracilimonas sp.]|uniref:transposase n=1 Tax=Gracilimonas sp. TaxID=1974203 RepID=UPI002870DDE7|nr:transposase [Gracilimonas sp.]